VLTTTFNSYGNRQISTPYKISTPEPIEKKFGTVDYVREGTPYTKFGTNPATEGFWANGWNITKFIFIYLYLFFWDSRTGQTGWWIFTRNSSLDVKSRKDVLFGVMKLEFNIKPLFISKNCQILAKTGQFFFAWKCLTMSFLKSKLPLIFIVAP